jgi:hypothetical protein
MEPASESHHEEKEKSFEIGVVYNGTEKHQSVTRDELIKAVLDRAIQEFHITQQPHTLSLFAEDGHELSDNTTVGQNDLSKKSVLYLRPSKVKGGSRGC